ncbi:MAG: VOC family protein [Anaerolineae bacterium]|jgi:catechol 2,3-dioxygenase-like lactoylglutathione lyase family enzyme
MLAEFRLIFRAKDYEPSVAFYRDGLELMIVHSWDRGPDQRGTVFQAASGLIEVLALAADRDYVPPQGVEIAFEVEDVDAWYQRVQQKGLPIQGELANKPWGHRTFSVTDPDNIKVIVFSVIK